MSLFGFGPPNVEKLKAKSDVQGLIKALTYQKDENVPKAAAEALGQIGDQRAIEPLIAMLRQSKTWKMRNAAIEALGKLGVAAVEPMIAILSDKNGDVRKALD